MKRVCIWALGILLGLVLAFTGWKGFTNPELLMGETNAVKGRIVDVFPNHDVKTYNRKIKYAYPVNGKYLFDFKKLGIREEGQKIGNKLKIVYSTKYPKWNKINRLLNDNKNSKGEKYYLASKNGYTEIHFVNGVFKYKKFANKGKIVNDFVGEYLQSNDTIGLKYYDLNSKKTTKKRPELFVFDSSNSNHLIEINTNEKFRKITNSR
jgi:hypothetical protein